MRPIWQGSISFGLVNIPIALYNATRREELRFHLLRAKDLSPINYKRVAEADGKEVPWEEIVKGYEYEKGKYIVLKEEDFKKADVEATQTVDIVDFVDLKQINPMFFSKPYYLEPKKGGEKAYILLREALQQTGKAGIARVVIKARQHLAVVKPQDDKLSLELLHFANELIDPADLKIPKKISASKSELEMAKTLISRMSAKWEPEKYKDEYRTALMQLIEEKIRHGGREVPAKGNVKPTTNVIDLAKVLKQSLEESEKKLSKKADLSSKHKTKKAA
jgi:DNA end-binding protein Ku